MNKPELASLGPPAEGIRRVVVHMPATDDTREFLRTIGAQSISDDRVAITMPVPVTAIYGVTEAFGDETSQEFAENLAQFVFDGVTRAAAHWRIKHGPG
jgi:hypothetical protein